MESVLQSSHIAENGFDLRDAAYMAPRPCLQGLHSLSFLHPHLLLHHVAPFPLLLQVATLEQLIFDSESALLEKAGRSNDSPSRSKLHVCACHVSARVHACHPCRHNQSCNLYMVPRTMQSKCTRFDLDIPTCCASPWRAMLDTCLAQSTRIAGQFHCMARYGLAQAASHSLGLGFRVRWGLGFRPEVLGKL